MRLIDADALIERLGIKAECDDCQYQNGPLCKRGSEFVDACEAIFDAPTIEERKTGRWIEIEQQTIYVCPFCKYASSKKNFCGECGADMRGEVQND